MRKLISIFLFGTLLSCSNSNDKKEFEDNIFISNRNQSILGFDLSNDKTLKSSLIISIKEDSNSVSRTTLLPFTTEDISSNNNFLCSTLSVTGHTVVNYNVLGSERDKLFVLNVIPNWEEVLDINNNNTIFWIKSGLNRKFIYEPFKNQSGVNQRILQLKKICDTINVIGLKLPIDSKIIEIRNEKNEIITADIIGSCRYYNLQKVPQNKLEVEYQIKPSKEQLKFVDLLLKLLGIITIPLIQLFVLKENRSKPKLRMTIIIIGILLELLVIGLIARYSILNDSFSSLYDLSLYLIGASFSGIVIYLNRK